MLNIIVVSSGPGSSRVGTSSIDSSGPSSSCVGTSSKEEEGDATSWKTMVLGIGGEGKE